MSGLGSARKIAISQMRILSAWDVKREIDNDSRESK